MIDIENEFSILGIEVLQPIPQAILRMAEIHMKQGHLGFSHGFAIGKLRMKAEEMMSYISRENQFRYIHEDIEIWIDSFEDEMDKLICREVRDCLKVLADVELEDQRQCLDWYLKLIEGVPISPLTGEDEEWCEYETGEYQNKRCRAVFKEDNKAYYLYAVVFNEKDGIRTFIGSVLVEGVRYLSHQYIKFPYEPVTNYVEVERVYPEDPESNEYRFVNPEKAKAIFDLFE